MYKIILKNKSFFDNLNDFEKIIKKDNQKDYQFFEPPDDQIINQEIEKDLFNPDFSFQRIQIFLFFDLNFPINNWKDRILALKEKYRRINFCFLSEGKDETEWIIQKEHF